MQTLQIRDPQIVRQIERISEHYRSNIANRFIRPVLLQLPFEKQSWDLIELLTEKVGQFRYQGYLLDELYREIAAAAHFVALVRREIVPSLKKRIEKIGTVASDKVLQDMAVNAFASNLRLFADLVYELYVGLVELDKKNSHGFQPLYAKMVELQNIGALLVEE
ncbi:MAG: hypothetical protein LBI86_03370 [Treponema sp.]|jgi:hypothetical protein|nr:hypothetical protein [Treponema sp.]